MCHCGGIPEQNLALSKEGLQLHELRQHQSRSCCGCRIRVMTGMHVHPHVRVAALVLHSILICGRKNGLTHVPVRTFLQGSHGQRRCTCKRLRPEEGK